MESRTLCVCGGEMFSLSFSVDPFQKGCGVHEMRKQEIPKVVSILPNGDKLSNESILFI